jgi:hypothetical protein
MNDDAAGDNNDNAGYDNDNTYVAVTTTTPAPQL